VFSLQHKVIVVTGSSGLIGSKIVALLRKAGATVVEADLHFKQTSAFTFTLDITDEDSVNKTVAAVVEQFGKIDGWVNNAFPRTKDWGSKLEDVPAASWKQNVDMHLNGYFLCCKAVLEQMKQQGSGSLINMGSIYGVVAPDFTVYEGTEMTSAVAYSAIKGGIIQLSKYLASYYGPHHVRVNCVSPGGIFDHQAEAFVKNYSKKVPLRRMGNPDDIAPAIHFLLSDEASYITGHNLMVDGGWSTI
jgi:NAD(P)-dependent dehydrogenase (short-subunit alcohol dehydrogenase family)